MRISTTQLLIEGIGGYSLDSNNVETYWKHCEARIKARLMLFAIQL